jgi:L-ribulokinase
MAIVAGVDFGTLSVRVSIVDSERGLLASAISEYPLHRKREDPDFATQSHEDHMRALAEATRQAVKSAGISGDQVKSIALDTTGSSVIPVGEGMVPLDDYYLWCDHRAKQEAAQSTELARLQSSGVVGCTHRNGGSRSCCTGCGTIQRSVKSLSAPLNTATWSQPRFVGSLMPGE